MNLKAYCRIIFLIALAAIISDFFGYKSVFYLLKPLTTIFILLLPLFFPKKSLLQYRRDLITGFLFCLIGDVLLLKASLFVWGLVSFFTGHLFFIRAFRQLLIWHWSFKIGLPLLVFAVLILFLIYPQLGTLLIPVVFYMGVLVVMSWQGIHLSLQTEISQFKRIGIGSILFLISDTLIALDKFYESFSGSGILILATYWLAIGFFALTASKSQ